MKENQIRTNWDNDWVIGVSMTPSHDMIAVLLAIWKSGAAYLPFETTYPQPYIEHILVESKPCLMIYEGDFEWRSYQKKARGVKFIKLFDLMQNLMDQEQENIPRSKSMSPDQNPLALVVYIPHKSEPPKGVRLGHLTGQNSIEWKWFEFPFSETEENIIAWSPITSINHFSEIFPSLLAGKTVLVLNNLRETIATVSEVVKKFQVQRLNVFPSLLQKILVHISETSENKFDDVKLWINHGDVLPIKLVERFFDFFDGGSFTIANIFGAVEFMAEAIFFKVNSRDQLANFSSFPIGSPIANMRVYIMNGTKELVNVGEIGYINIAGLPVCDGFCNNRDDELIEMNTVSAIPMFSRLLTTDDLGKIVDGLVFFEGRNDLQVNMKGYQIQVTEVETVFSSLLCVDKVLIEIYERGGADQAVLAFVILKQAHALVTSIDIVNELLTKIPSYSVPEIYIVKQFPYTQNGKVNINYLLKIHEEKTKKKREKVNVEMNLKDVLEGDIEKAVKVFQIIGESIGNPQGLIISPESNFYDIGGNSLNTLLCLEQLRAQNFDISLDDFLSAKNLREVLKIIEIRFPGRKSKMTYEVENKLKLYAQILNEKFKPECIKIITKAYCEKVFNKFIEDIECDQISSFLEHNWNFFVDQEYSFMILNEKDKPVGVSLNFEVGDEPKESIPPSIESILEFIRSSKNDIM